jgi:hypothetical protein
LQIKLWYLGSWTNSLNYGRAPSIPQTARFPALFTTQDAQGRMYLTSHNLNYDISILGNSILVPNIPLLNITNNVTGFGSLGVGAADSDNMWSFPPKFLNVDYYEVGNGSIFEVAATYNNVTYNRTCCGLPGTDSARLGTTGRGAMISTGLAVLLSWMIL